MRLLALEPLTPLGELGRDQPGVRVGGADMGFGRSYGFGGRRLLCPEALQIVSRFSGDLLQPLVLCFGGSRLGHRPPRAGFEPRAGGLRGPD